jgi:hypothetical protein
MDLVRLGPAFTLMGSELQSIEIKSDPSAQDARADAPGRPSEARLRSEPRQYPLDLRGLPAAVSGALDTSTI